MAIAGISSAPTLSVNQGWSLGIALAAAAAIGWGLLVRRRRDRETTRLLRELEEKNRELQDARRDRQQAIELAHLDRVNSLGKMASTIAHELNQPLFAIMSLAGAARRTLEKREDADPQILEDIELISSQADRAGEIIRRLKNFSRLRDFEKKPVDLNDVVEETVRFIESEARVNGIDVTVELLPAPRVALADSVLIQQVVLNLAKNAMEALAEKETQDKRLLIQTSNVEGDRIEVSVSDNGAGSKEADPEHLFSPFFSTKPDGMGMGLSISRSIVESHEGELHARRNPEQGMTFAFDLRVTAMSDD